MILLINQIRETVAAIERSKLNFVQFKTDLDENSLDHDELESQIKEIKKQLTESKGEEVRGLDGKERRTC